jgi:hypothetical protein
MCKLFTIDKANKIEAFTYGKYHQGYFIKNNEGNKACHFKALAIPPLSPHL